MDTEPKEDSPTKKDAEDNIHATENQVVNHVHPLIRENQDRPFRNSQISTPDGLTDGQVPDKQIGRKLMVVMRPQIGRHFGGITAPARTTNMIDIIPTPTATVNISITIMTDLSEVVIPTRRLDVA